LWNKKSRIFIIVLYLVRGAVKKMNRFILSTTIVLWSLFTACDSRSTDRKDPLLKSAFTQTIPLIQGTFKIAIPFNGVLEPWKNIDVSLPDTAILIGVMAEEGSSVSKDELLATALISAPRKEYIPVNIISPIDGTITGIYFTLNDTIPAGGKILSVTNFDRLRIKAKLKPYQMAYVRENADAELFFDNAIFSGYVVRIIQQEHSVEILTKKEYPQLPPYGWIKGQIKGSLVKGTYIQNDFFNQNDSLKILVAGDISLTIRRVGMADSLALIYPTVPDVDKVSIIEN